MNEIIQLEIMEAITVTDKIIVNMSTISLEMSGVMKERTT